MFNVFRMKRSARWPMVPAWSLVVCCSVWLGTIPPLVAAPASGPTEAAKVVDELEAADQQYQQFLDQFYRQYLKNRESAPAPSIQVLAQVVESASVLDAIAIIRRNQDLLLQNASQKEFNRILEFLYRNNDTATVKALTDALRERKESAALSYNYFLLAKYYESRHNWQGVQGALSRVDLRELNLSDHHYYHLLMGYALQNLKQHRQALKFYQEIPPTSPYFSHVKLNEGTAFLRQGWWTEAHIEFEKAIKALDQSKEDTELRNRILVVLGYSQLNYEFYRDARETFRRVALDSGAMNKALMGIGLAAAYQKDFASAANAFRILAEKKPSDLSVDEAYLLLPVALTEAGDGAAAAIAYQQAIHHYETKIQDLQALQARLKASDFDVSLQTIRELDSRAEEIYGGQRGLPEFLLNNYQNLLALRDVSAAQGLGGQFTALHEDYKKRLQRITHTNVDSRLGMLNSYLSQAKFGMAQLYDKP